MDFLKKFFENIYLFVVDTIRDFLGGLLLLLRYPIKGPHIMLRRHRLEWRTGIDPSFFLFLASVCVLLFFFAELRGASSSALGLVESRLTKLDEDDLNYVLSKGKPNERLNQLIVAGFVFALTISAIVGTIVTLRRIQFGRRRNRPLRLRTILPAERIRLAAAPYAAVYAVLMAFIILSLISQVTFLQTLYVGIASVLDWPFATKDVFSISGWPLTTFDIALLITTILVLTPATIPLAYVLFFSRTPLRKGVNYLRTVPLAAALVLPMMLPLVTSISTFIWLSATKDRPAVKLTHLVCDMAEWPYFTATAYLENNTGDTLVLYPKAFRVGVLAEEEDNQPLSSDDDTVKPPASIHAMMRVSEANIVAVGQAKRQAAYAMKKDEAALLTLQGRSEWDQWRNPEQDKDWVVGCNLDPVFSQIFNAQGSDIPLRTEGWVIDAPWRNENHLSRKKPQ